MMPLAEADLRMATRVAGTVAYALAAGACAYAAARATERERGWWLGLSAAAAVLVAETQVNLRFEAAGFLSGIARSGHWYADRRPVQAGFLVLMGLLWLLGMVIMQWRMRKREGGLRLALMGAGIAVGMLGLEIVSLHQVDEYLNANAGPIMGVGWGWVAGGGLMVAGGAWRARSGLARKH